MLHVPIGRDEHVEFALGSREKLAIRKGGPASLDAVEI
jgi:hypothetical protein